MKLRRKCRRGPLTVDEAQLLLRRMLVDGRRCAAVELRALAGGELFQVADLLIGEADLLDREADRLDELLTG